MIDLRPYQSALKANTRSEWQAGARNVLAVLPTGGGKTVYFASELRDEQNPSCVIAHRQELVGQISLALARNHVRHRIIAPMSVIRLIVAIHIAETGRSYYDANAPCAVAGVDTLIRGNADPRWLASVRLWVCDEAHHLLAANKWGKAVALFPNARGLGVTATPIRADGKGLGRHADGLIDSMVEGPSMRWLIDNGYLTPYRVFAPKSDIDLSAVPIGDSGDYNPEKLRAAAHKSHIVGDVVEGYLKFAAGKLGVTFAVDIESATDIAARYRDAGVPAEVITSKTPDNIRAAILRRFRNREIQQLVNVDLFGEGFDLPAIEAVSMARPTASYGLYVQQFGRSLRPMEGKQHALVIDHVDNVERHLLPDARREWSLDRRDRRSKGPATDAIPLRVCPNCTSPYERIHRACPWCGYAPEPAGRSTPEEVDGEILEMDEASLARLRGEIAKVDGLGPGHGDGMVGRAINRTHWERQQAQADLRAAIALWAGWQRSLGRTDEEGYRRFYHGFGVDVATAQTLGAREAETLRVAIDRTVKGALV